MKLFHRMLGEGPPLLILHGLFGSSDNWQTHARVLSNTHSVYLVDQRNHGHSPHDTEMDYTIMANDLFELIADLGLRDVRLIGHSMGGKTILRFAQLYGFLIEKMVVADMGIKAYPPHHDEVLKGLFAVDVSSCPSRKEAENRLSAFVHDEGTQQFLLKNLYWKEQGALAWRFNLEAINTHRENIMAALPAEKVDVDTLFLTGGRSHYVPENDHDSIRRLVHAPQFKSIPDAGHWLHADRPHEFIGICQEYFSS
ncbi:MAG: alpha/beta fold hydrolase [Flavobacteriales bacterium]